MTEQIPTPTPEQVQQWLNRLAGDTWRRTRTHTPNDVLLAACAAEWGAEQELDACCEFETKCYGEDYAAKLRRYRRPQPKSRKQRALDALAQMEDQYLSAELAAEIRNALEELPDD